MVVPLKEELLALFFPTLQSGPLYYSGYHLYIVSNPLSLVVTSDHPGCPPTKQRFTHVHEELPVLRPPLTQTLRRLTAKGIGLVLIAAGAAAVAAIAVVAAVVEVVIVDVVVGHHRSTLPDWLGNPLCRSFH